MSQISLGDRLPRLWTDTEVRPFLVVEFPKHFGTLGTLGVGSLVKEQARYCLGQRILGLGDGLRGITSMVTTAKTSSRRRKFHSRRNSGIDTSLPAA